MAPTLVVACCGIGSGARGFQDAGFSVKMGTDEDLLALAEFRRHFPHARTTTHVEWNARKYTRELDVLLMTPRELLTQCERSYSFYFSGLVEQLKPRVAVLVVPTKSARGMWLANYTEAMRHHCYDTVIVHTDTSEFGVAVKMHRSVCISVSSSSLDGDPRQILGSVIEDFANKRIVTLATPRTSLGVDTSPVFLYPRTKGEKGVFSQDEPLPLLRTNACTPPPPDYTVSSEDHAPVSEAKELGLSDIVTLMGMPPSFEPSSATSSKTMAMYQITRSLPPPFMKALAEAVMAIPVLEVPAFDKRRIGDVFPVIMPRLKQHCQRSHEQSSSLAYAPKASTSTKQPVRATSRLDKLLMASKCVNLDVYDKYRDSSKKHAYQKEERRMVTYVVGSCPSGDACVNTFTGTKLPSDWSIIIRERNNTKHARDDLILMEPTGKYHYTIASAVNAIKTSCRAR